MVNNSNKTTPIFILVFLMSATESSLEKYTIHIANRANQGIHMTFEALNCFKRHSTASNVSSHMTKPRFGKVVRYACFTSYDACVGVLGVSGPSLASPRRVILSLFLFVNKLPFSTKIRICLLLISLAYFYQVVRVSEVKFCEHSSASCSGLKEESMSGSGYLFSIVISFSHV